MPAKLFSISEEGYSSATSSSVTFAGQPHSSLPVTAGSTLASQPVLTTTDTTTVCSTVAGRSDRLFQSLTTTVVPKDQNIFNQRSTSVPDDSDGSLVKSKPMPKGGCLYCMMDVSIICSVPITEKALSNSSLSENDNNQPVGSEESVAVKEKDEVFATSSDGAKQLKGLVDSTTQPAVTSTTTVAAPTVTSVGDVMKNDSSPVAVKKATPKTQPHVHPPSTSVMPSVSTGDL